MNHLNATRFAISVLLASSALAAVSRAQAQPMMGEMSMHHDEGRMHERMVKHWEQREAELKTKLHLTPSQEPAWTAFVQGMKRPTQPLAQNMDRDALAKLSTPERMEKMNAVHEANLAAMQTHIKQRSEATRTFYNQLSVEQQKIFDAETLPEHSRWKGKRD
jgi:flagellum-specific peptidoglycan hydrolase FlgJ